MVNKTWENIWNNRPMSSEVSLETAIKLSGFDAGLGAESLASWLHYTHKIVKLLGIKKGETVIEYGCGAGSLLEGLRQHVHCNVMGVDYSHKLLSYARQLVVGEFIHSNITNFESEKMFTYSLSNSVFQYLSENDAKKVMNSMLSSAEKKIAIFDIPDSGKREAAEAARIKENPKLLSGEQQDGPQHTYFMREFFEDFANNNQDPNNQ